MDFEIWHILILLVLGYIAGVINTLAGGGSNLTLPALMVLGMPADIANATNRVGIIMQTIWGAKSFHGHGELPLHDVKAIFIPLSIGGVLGALSASYAPVTYLKPVLLLTMISMSLIIICIAIRLSLISVTTIALRSVMTTSCVLPWPSRALSVSV